MRNKYTSRIYILTAIILQACGKSFLDAPPGNVLPREEVITNIDDCEKLFRSTYIDLAAAFGTFTDIYPEIVADNVRPVIGSTTLRTIYNWEQVANDSRSTSMSQRATNMNAFSYRFYNLIRTSNFLIEKSEEFREQNRAKSDYITGSALTLRAYSYYLLINVFAQPYNYSSQATHPGIVYVTSSNWTDPINGRSNVGEVYRKMIADLERAIPLFHDETTTTIRHNKDFPTALLSRILLASESYSSSLNYARNCIKRHPLLSIEKGYPDNIYKKSTPAESEALFHLLPLSSSSLGYNGTAQFSNRYYVSRPDLVATSNLVQILTENANDIRNKWVTDGGPKGWKVTKFPGGAIEDVLPTELSYFQPLARVSEMYLNAAECFYHLQQQDSALHYINKLILRADPTATPASASGQELLDLIRKERRKELAFEGFRLYDLQRWKLPVVRPDDQQYHMLSLPAEKALAPLPVQDLQSPGVPQNPGY